MIGILDKKSGCDSFLSKMVGLLPIEGYSYRKLFLPCNESESDFSNIQINRGNSALKSVIVEELQIHSMNSVCSLLTVRVNGTSYCPDELLYDLFDP